VLPDPACWHFRSRHDCFRIPTRNSDRPSSQEVEHAQKWDAFWSAVEFCAMWKRSGPRRCGTLWSYMATQTRVLECLQERHRAPMEKSRALWRALPLPPNFGLSRQFKHRPQSSRQQDEQRPQATARFLFFGCHHSWFSGPSPLEGPSRIAAAWSASADIRTARGRRS